ncbi:MAG: type II secretion system protein [Patescibacteria group bacterium]
MKTSLLKKIRGFTLIELLVVIAIIALLTGIVMTNLTGSKSKARDAKRVSDVGQVQLALELFFDRCKVYPLLLELDDDGAGACPSNITLGTFIGKIPTDPTTSLAYDYVSGVVFDYSLPNTGSEYFLRAQLEADSPALRDDLDDLSPEPDDDDLCTDSPVKYYCIGSR